MLASWTPTRSGISSTHPFGRSALVKARGIGARKNPSNPPTRPRYPSSAPTANLWKIALALTATKENADDDPEYKAHLTRTRVNRWLQELAPDPDARRKLATDWDAHCTAYEKAADAFSAARRRFDVAEVLLIPPDNLPDLERALQDAQGDFQDARSNRVRFLRWHLDWWPIPVSVLDHLRREHRPQLEPVPF